MSMITSFELFTIRISVNRSSSPDFYIKHKDIMIKLKEVFLFQTIINMAKKLASSLST